MKYSEIFKNKKILITGNTGFKGSWLTIWLNLLGAKLYGISNNIPTQPSLFKEANLDQIINNNFIDIKDIDKVHSIIKTIKPDFIFHLAAQPLVSKSYSNPTETWQTNVIGTVNILESLRLLNKNCIGIIITSDKCYENQEWVWGYRESDRLGGSDPYSATKGAAELAFNSFYRSFFSEKSLTKIRIASARAGNVIGGGDWTPNRLIPDCVKSWSKNKKPFIRNPNATRPWQHVLEVIYGYLLLSIKTVTQKSLL